MGNQRPAIRAALKTMLSGHTSAGTNVYTNRETRLWKSELPAIIITTPDEPAERRSQGSKQYIRTLELKVEAKIEASTSVDDDVDALASAIEDLIEADQTIGGTCLGTNLKTSEIKVDSDGEKDVGVLTLTYDCQYIA